MQVVDLLRIEDENVMEIHGTIHCPKCNRIVANDYGNGVMGYKGIPCVCGYFNQYMKKSGERFIANMSLDIAVKLANNKPLSDYENVILKELGSNM